MAIDYNSYIKVYEDILNRLGWKDRKTDAYNYMAFDLQLIKTAHYNKTITVLFVDINELEHVNEWYGVQTGYKFVNDVMEVIRKFFPRENLYRRADDEFIIISDSIETGKAMAMKEFMWQHKDLASIGFASGNGIEVEKVLDKAEADMYKDKKRFYEKYPRFKKVLHFLNRK